MEQIRNSHCDLLLVLTSGVPFGSKNASGTTLDILGLGVALGGEGLVEYSVREKVFMLGVRGLESWPVPLILTPFSIVNFECTRFKCTLKRVYVFVAVVE